LTVAREAPSLDTLGNVVMPAADDLVYASLRREIVHGLPPGTLLRLRDLAARFAVSTMPIREALDRLHAEGLVTQSPRRGATVAPLVLADLEDIQTVRAGIEGVAVRLGVPRMTDESLRTVRRGWDRHQAAWQRHGAVDLDEYVTVTTATHDACTSTTGMPKLMRLIASYRAMAERYLRMSLNNPDELASDIPKEEEFLAACERRDPAAAEEALHELLRWTLDRVAPLLGGG
jgi:DNA-binding GntR family transcriptional regulator